MAEVVDYLMRAEGDLARLQGEAEGLGQATLAFLLDIARREIADELVTLRRAATPASQGRGALRQKTAARFSVARPVPRPLRRINPAPQQPE